MRKYKIYIDGGVCSSWGRILPKHIFKTQYAPKRGHLYCLNCGITKREARKEEKFNQANEIETRIFDYHSDLENPTFLRDDNDYQLFDHERTS